MSRHPLCRVDDGLGVSLLLVRCAWCEADLGAKICEPAMAGQVSHGICDKCADDMRAQFDRSRGRSDAASGQGAGRAPARVTGTTRPGWSAASLPGEHAASVGPAASETFNTSPNL